MNIQDALDLSLNEEAFRIIGKSEKQAIKPPGQFNVVLHNDDFTPFELVTVILVRVFNKGMEEALAITQNVHVQGKGIAGQYTRDIAETKREVAMAWARENECPLQLTVEAAP